jgi:DNA-binding response OmpR family regulator
MDGTTTMSVSENVYEEFKREVRTAREECVVAVEARFDKLEEKLDRRMEHEGRERGGQTRPVRQTEAIVNRLVIVHKPGQASVVYVDNIERPLRLRRCRTLVDLLLALCSKERGVSRGDGMVSVKSQDDLVALISERRQYPIDKPTVRAHVLRLRKQLEDDGLDRAFVETIKGGYRFRLAEDGQVIERYEDV